MGDKKVGEPYEKVTFNVLCEKIRENGEITDEQKERLIKIFGSRFSAAYRAVEERRVKKHLFDPSGRVIWVVAGNERDYHVLPLANFCSCFDFYFRVVGHEASLCYHIITKKLAEALNRYDVIKEPDADFAPLLEELRIIPRHAKTLTTEETENIRRVARGILFEGEELPIDRLLEELKEAGFASLTVRHLVNILIADKMKRFKHLDGLWRLAP